MIPSRPRGKGSGVSEALLEEKRRGGRGGLLFPSLGGQCSGQMQDGLRWLGPVRWVGDRDAGLLGRVLELSKAGWLGQPQGTVR